MHISKTYLRVASLAMAMSVVASVASSGQQPARAGTSKSIAASMPKATQPPLKSQNLFRRVASPYSFIGSTPAAQTALPHIKASSREQSLPVTESQLFAAYGDSQTGYFDYGIYSLSMTAPAATTMVENIMDMNLENCAGAVYADGKYFFAEEMKAGSYVFRMNYHIYDASDWREISNNSNGDTEFQAQDMTFDPVSGNVYGFFVKKVGSEYHSVFGTFDMTTGTQTDIADLGSMAVRAIAATEDGRLFGIGADGVLYRIDKATGVLTSVGNTGLHSEYITTGTIDPRSGLFYYYLCNDNSNALYTVDVTTAAATKLYDFTDFSTSLAGMYVIAPAADPKAPAAVQNLQLEFNGASLSGFVKFTTPYTLFDDSGATGEITYSVILNGETVLSGTTEFGTRLALPLTVPAPGEYTVGVRVSNEAGQSPLVQTSRWIGAAVPAPLKNVKLTYSDGNMHLTWDAPTALAGNNFDPDATTFTVTRYPGAETVASAITTRSFTEAMEIPESLTEYYYEVVADFEGSVSTPSQSNRIALGNLVPPFADAFDVPSSLDKYTVLDANNDKITWEWLNLDGNGCLSTGFNSSMAMNDWLILPAAKLKKGVNYQILFDVSVLASTPSHHEKLEVLIGDAPAVESLTGTIIPVTEFRNTTPMEVKEFFSVDADGTYYIAIHICSNRDMYRLHLDNLSISAPIATTVPDAVTNPVVTPAADGSLKATITFTAPSTDINGNPLKSLSGVKVFRGETLLGEATPSIGGEGSFTDNNASEGVNTYSLIPYNEDGDGREATVEKYIGIGSPLATTIVEGKLGQDDGEVKLSWTPVTADVNGFTLTSSMVTYTVCRIVDGVPVELKTGIEGTSFTHRACAPDATQEFAYYSVAAETKSGKSAQIVSNMVAVGAPYAARFAESFAAGGANSIWYNMAPAYPRNGSWVGVTSDVSAGYGMMPHDGDNGLLLFGGPFIGCEAYIFSGKIALTGIERPALTFRYFDDGSGNILDAVVMTDMSTPQLLKTFVLETSDAEKQGWKKGVADLSAFTGKTIQIGFRGEIVTNIATAVDNVRIISDVENNLAAIAMNAPATVKPASDFTVSVTLLNTGRNIADNYTVDLYRDGQVVASQKGKAVEPDETVIVQFSDILSPATDARTSYHAVVNFAGDGDAEDDTTPAAIVNVMHNSYPAISDLTGSVGGNGEIALSWSEHDPTGVSIAVTDDVETLTPFSIGLPSTELGAEDNVGDWTMIDGDGSITYGIDAGSSDDDWVKFPNTRKEMAFQVFNGELAGVRGWDAYSGKQMFACFAATVAPNNDWLISPELNGREQTISFMARSLTLQYPESFEVLYSTTGKSVADFKRVDAVQTVPATWTEYRYELPEGARYFAIHCNSYDAFALLVDYITYTGVKNPGDDLAIVGYNIYRDGALLNPEPVMEPEFTDVAPSSESAKYRVTVVYNMGESAPSNIYSAVGSGLDSVLAAGSAIAVEVRRGEIIITGADGLTAAVYATDGTLRKSATCTANTRLMLSQGIYLLRVGTNVYKLRIP